MKYIFDKNKHANWITFAVISNNTYYSLWGFKDGVKFCLRSLADVSKGYKDCISFKKETGFFNNIDFYTTLFNTFLNL